MARFLHILIQRTVIAVALVAAGVAQAQVYVTNNIDILTGLGDSTILATTVPSTGTLHRAFDGNVGTELRLQNSGSLVVTLWFLRPPLINKSRVFFWTNGSWKLEAAETEEDLQSRTGSYALLRDSLPAGGFKWDSVTFTRKSIGIIRLSSWISQGNDLFLGEWALEESRLITSYAILPYPPRVIPGFQLHVQAKMLDDQNDVYPVPATDTLIWSVADTAIASIRAPGLIHGNTLGLTTVSVRNALGTLAGEAPLSVEQDFQPEEVPPHAVKVALVIPDPVVMDGKPLHEIYRWHDPLVLTADVIQHFYESSNGLVQFTIVETIITDSTYSRYNGQLMSVADYMYHLNRGDLQKDPGPAKFDYVELVKRYGFDDKRNNGEIDEVWVYSPPWTGMWESQLMGPSAFWWNSPPITTGTNLTRLLSVMGLNYERGVDMALESFGHRFESALIKTYEDAQGRSWEPTSPDPTPWDLFTRYDKIMPDKAHVGNIHFPPNGQADYDFGNARYVLSYADNWMRYPYLLNQTRLVNVNEWTYWEIDPLAENQDGLGYLRWWYNHLPRYAGITDGVLNNWWHYALDYEGAVALAEATPVLSVKESRDAPMMQSYTLEQNFPNPFNPTTSIRWHIPARASVTLTVYDFLGREIAILIHGDFPPGTHVCQWDGRNAAGRAVASGAYFVRLEALPVVPHAQSPVISIRKMLLLR